MIYDDNKEELESKSYSFTDYQKVRKSLLKKSVESLRNSFPISWGGVTLEATNFKYNPDTNFSLKQQKDALINEKFLGVPIKADLRLKDSSTGQLLSEIKSKTLMNVPYYTERGTFIHGGNEYSTIKQLRLKPGIYNRKKANGILESQFNIKKGTSPSGYSVTLDPATGIYKFNVQQSSTSLYSLLHDLGVPDSDLEKAWGTEIFLKNKEKYDKRALDKIHSKLIRARESTAESREDKIEELKKAFNETQKVDKHVKELNIGL